MNEVFINQYQIDARYYINIGGRGSGKSFGVTQQVLLQAMADKKNVIVFRKYQTKIKKSIFKLFDKMVDVFGLTKKKHYNKTVSPLHFDLIHSASAIDFEGLDDIDKSKGLEDYDVAVIEELSEFTEDEFNAIDAIMRNRGARIYAMSNPIAKIAGRQHWIEKRFLNHVPNENGKNLIFTIEREIEGEVLKFTACVLRTTYRDNYFCEPAFKLMLENLKQTNYDLWRMWANGEFTEFKGAILDNGYSVINEIPDSIPFMGYGLDFGFANDPAAVIKVCKHNNDLYLEEIVYSTGLTNDELYSTMVKGGVNNNDSVIADSAEPKSIEELRRAGLRYTTGSKKYKGHKREAAQYLRGCNIHVVKGSTNLMTELSTWSWETDKEGNIKPDAKPADGNDHLIDALIYRLAIRPAINNLRFVVG